MGYGTGIVSPPFGATGSVSGALYNGYTPYPRSNVEHYWWAAEDAITQWSMNSLFAGSSSCGNTIGWGLYQTTIPSMYGQGVNWLCGGMLNPYFPGDCCPQLAPGVSYNTKMLVVWDSYDMQIAKRDKATGGVGNPCNPASPGGGHKWIYPQAGTPIFWQVSSSGTAPCDTNGVSPYPWEELIQFANDLCPWNYSQSLSMSLGLVAGDTWQDGIYHLLTNATSGPSGENTSADVDVGFGGILILRNNDVRGVDLYRCRQNWNPRLLNVYPLSESFMYSATPASNEDENASPFEKPANVKPYASMGNDWKVKMGPYPLFSLAPGPNGEVYQTSESFFYGSGSIGGVAHNPYDWQIKTTIPNAPFSNTTGSLTIEFLINPTWGQAGPQLSDGEPTVGGYDNYSPGSVGKWMPILTKKGAVGEYSVWVDTSTSRSLAFGYSIDGTGDGQVWFTSSNDVLNGDQHQGGDLRVWYHCAVTRNFEVDFADEDGLKWFINGQPQKRCPWGWGIFQNPTQSYCEDNPGNLPVIASDRDSKQWNTKLKTYYSGSIGFIRIYERPLNQYQILTNFYKAGVWCDYDGYNEDIVYPYDYDGTTYNIEYNPNGGKLCDLELFIDHGNLVSDQGFTNTTGSHIFNIREYSSSIDTDGFYIFNGRWSGSQWPAGINHSNDMKISQSSDGYQTYDSMNGARFYPGSNTDSTKPEDDEYAYEWCGNVRCNYGANKHNTLEMWIRLATTTGSNSGDGSDNRVVFNVNTYRDDGHGGTDPDFGIMYNSDGFGFWDGDRHFGIPWDQCREYLMDRWCFVQAQINTSHWSQAYQGSGFLIGLNGDYWSGDSDDYGDLELLSTPANWAGVSSPPFTATHSLSFMGNWEGQQANNASGSIAEIHWYSDELNYNGPTNYAYGPAFQIYPYPNLNNYDFASDTPYQWLQHNWAANKVRFGMGGDKSWT